MKKMKNEKSTIGLALILMSLILLPMAGILADENDTGFGSSQNEQSSLIELKLSPNVQQADENGVAIYRISITDKHDQVLTESEDSTYEYTLTGMSGNDNVVQFSFEWGSTVTLEAGETIIKEFKAEVSEEGTHKIVIRVETEGTSAMTSGVIIFGTGNQGSLHVNPIGIPGTPINNAPLFQGQGFALSEDESQGYRIDLALLKADANEITGKMTIGNSVFKIRGTFDEQVGGSDANIEFEFMSIENGETAGRFLGTIEKFGEFAILRGTLRNYKGKDWDLTVMSHSRRVIPMQMIGPTVNSQQTSIEDVLEISSENENLEENNFFAKPIKIHERKFLGFIPTGKKDIELEIVQGNDTFKKKIHENGNVFIKGYKISIGSLVDEENIEISIEAAE